MAKHSATPESILSTLSPEAASVLENHYRQQFVSELSAGLPSKPARGRPKASGTPGKKSRGPNRQKTNDGTDRSASQFIRDCDAANSDISAKDVCVKAAEVGLSIEPSLVYNVRQQARKKAASGGADAKAKADATYQKRVAALEKARAARKEKREAAEKAANAKTAKSAKKSK
jgi:hypothetical protein